MKRQILFGITLLACACLFALDAEVISLEGKAQVSSNGTSWSPLAVGSKVSQGSEIQTGFKSQLKLKVKGSVVTLNAMTRIKVDQLSEKGGVDNTVVSMKIGSLTSNVKKVEDRRAGFTVKGPAATASVRGTVLSEEVCYNRDTVTAIENTTMVWPSSQNGGSDEDSSEPAQVSARAIAPGQISSVNNAGGERTPQSNAAESAYGMGGAVATAAAAESVSSGGASDSFSSSADSSRGNPQSELATGSVAITITYKGE